MKAAAPAMSGGESVSPRRFKISRQSSGQAIDTTSSSPTIPTLSLSGAIKDLIAGNIDTFGMHTDGKINENPQSPRKSDASPRTKVKKDKSGSKNAKKKKVKSNSDNDTSVGSELDSAPSSRDVSPRRDAVINKNADNVASYDDAATIPPPVSPRSNLSATLKNSVNMVTIAQSTSSRDVSPRRDAVINKNADNVASYDDAATIPPPVSSRSNLSATLKNSVNMVTIAQSTARNIESTDTTTKSGNNTPRSGRRNAEASIPIHMLDTNRVLTPRRRAESRVPIHLIGLEVDPDSANPSNKRQGELLAVNEFIRSQKILGILQKQKDDPSYDEFHELTPRRRGGVPLLTSSSIHRKVEQNKELYQAMLYGKTVKALELDQVQDKISKNREERVKITRTLEAYKDKEHERMLQRKALEIEAIKQQKRELYETIIYEQVQCREVEKKLKDVDIKQQALLEKLEQIRIFREEKQVEFVAKHGEEYRSNVLRHLSSLIDSNLDDSNTANNAKTHEDVVKEVVANVLQEAVDHRDATKILTTQLKNKTKEHYDITINNLYSSRIDLTEEKKRIMTRWQELKGDNKALVPEGKELDNIENVYTKAVLMDELVAHSIGDINNRMDLATNETDWLGNHPDSAAYHEILKRIATTKDLISEGSTVEESELLKNYFQIATEHENIKSKEYKEKFIVEESVKIIGVLVEDVTRSLMNSLAKEILNIHVAMSSHLNMIIMKSVCFDRVENYVTPVLDKAGVFNIYLGSIQDLKRGSYGKENEKSYKQAKNKALLKSRFIVSSKYDVTRHPEENRIQDHYKVMRTQKVLRVNKQSTDKSAIDAAVMKDIRKEWSPSDVDSILSLRDAIRSTTTHKDRDDTISAAEYQHWNNVSIKPSIKSPIIISSPENNPVIMKLFPRYHLEQSVAVLGTKVGSILVYFIPWDGSPPHYYGVSKSLPRNERSPVIDIQEGNLNSTQFIVLTDDGHVRIFDLQVLNSTRSHRYFLFPKKPSDYRPSIEYIPCVHHISPIDFNIPLKLNLKEPFSDDNVTNNAVLGIADAKSNAFFKSNAMPQDGTKCCSISFHPSMTILGRHPSVLVGIEGGDMVKVNLDFKSNQMDTKITFIPPFVDREYVHPVSAPSGVIIAGGDENRKGNPVYREIHHYHKAKILFIGLVYKVSNYIVTIDSTAHMAVWKYDERHFEGKCWFRPESTYKLDLSVTEYVSKSEIGAAASAQDSPDSDSKFVYKELSAAPAFHPKAKTPLIRETTKEDNKTTHVYYPVSKGTELLQYKVISQVVNDPRKPNNNTTTEKWYCAKVKEFILTSRIEKIKSSYDGTRLFLLISYATVSKQIKFSVITIALDNPDTSASSKTAPEYSILKPRIELPSATLTLDPRDTVIDFVVGPVMKETLTRCVYIHTRLEGLRLFSLETGREITDTGSPITNDGFPFMPKLSKGSSYDPIISCVCTSQRAMIFGSSDDARVGVYIFTHSEDGLVEGLRTNLITGPVIAALKQPYQYMKKFAYSSIQENKFNDDYSDIDSQVMINGIMNEIVNERLWYYVDKHVNDKDYIRRSYLIHDLYGNDDHSLGYVDPTTWPDIEEEDKYKYVVGEEVSAEDIANDQVKTLQLLKKKAVHRLSLEKSPRRSVSPIASPRVQLNETNETKEMSNSILRLLGASSPRATPRRTSASASHSPRGGTAPTESVTTPRTTSRRSVSAAASPGENGIPADTSTPRGRSRKTTISPASSPREDDSKAAKSPSGRKKSKSPRSKSPGGSDSPRSKSPNQKGRKSIQSTNPTSPRTGGSVTVSPRKGSVPLQEAAE